MAGDRAVYWEWRPWVPQVRWLSKHFLIRCWLIILKQRRNLNQISFFKNESLYQSSSLRKWPQRPQLKIWGIRPNEVNFICAVCVYKDVDQISESAEEASYTPSAHFWEPVPALSQPSAHPSSQHISDFPAIHTQCWFRNKSLLLSWMSDLALLSAFP